MAVIPFLASCVGSNVSLLEDGAESDERLRRMNLLVEPWNAGDSTWKAPEEREISALQADVYDHCGYVVAQGTAMAGCFTGGPGYTGSECFGSICEAQRELCRALTFRELAQSLSPVILLNVAGNNAVRLRPQDPESQVALEQAAQHTSALAVSLTGTAIFDQCNSFESLEDHFESGSGVLEQNNAEFLATTLREALSVGEAAAEAGSRGALGLSDRDRASITDLGRSARLSWFDDNLSRLIAAQMNGGGVDFSNPWQFGTGDYVEDVSSAYFYDRLDAEGAAPTENVISIGSQAPCEGECATALGLLRRSGAPFGKIMDTTTVDINTLVQTEVAPRLNEQVGDSDFYSAASAESFSESLGFSLNALLEARSWMRHEASIFARPATGVAPVTPPIPPLLTGAPAASAFVSYDATTMAVPSQPPGIHFMTAARAGELWNVFGLATGTDSLQLPPRRPGRAYLFDSAHSIAQEAIPHLRSLMVSGGAVGVLATITQEATARGAIQTEVCRVGTTLRVRATSSLLSGAPQPGDYLLVQGITAARCAVEGRVENQPCTVGGTDPSWVSVTGTRLSRRRALEWIHPFASSDGFLYVIRRREDRSAGPGAYEAVAGIPLPLPAVGGPADGECVTIPYDFTSDQRATNAFLMRAGGFTPRSLCGDIDLDSPLPLEDSIIEDSDSYEDSWQHHLRVAASAAQHADELGQQLIQSGLQMDMRAEGAVDQIQELCGAHINLDELFGASGDLVDLVHTETCDESAGDYSCPTDYDCVGTVCVVGSLVEDDGSFERRAIRECLGIGDAGRQVPVVALGSTPLCYWYNTTEPRILCEDAPPGTCPFPLGTDSTGAYETTCGAPDGFTMGPHTMAVAANEEDMVALDTDAVPELLGLIASVSPDEDPLDDDGGGEQPDVPSEGLCDDIRAARAATTAEDARTALRDIRADDFFTYDNVRYWAGRIGWRGYPRDFSEITLDGAPWTDASGTLGSTGFPFAVGGRTAGAATRWPCATYTGVTGTGLFTSTVACPGEANQTSRAPMNARMGRAVATLGALAGIGLGNLQMPAFYNNTSVPFNESPGIERITDVYGDEWDLAGSAEFRGQTISGWIVVPVDHTSPVWTGIDGVQPTLSASAPFGFLNFGAHYDGDDDARARAIARSLWECMAGGQCQDAVSTRYDFYSAIAGEGGGLAASGAPMPGRYQVFRRALVGVTAADPTVFLNNDRGPRGNTDFGQLAGLFERDAYGLGQDHRNLAHLFVNHGGDYAAHVTRRDLLDAMELMCQVASTVPPNDVPPAPAQPVIYSMADAGSVQLYAEQAAARIDEIARRQVVQDVPLEVVEVLRAESGATVPDAGSFGDGVNRLRQQLRLQGEAPRDIASAFRSIAAELEVMKRNQQIFRRTKTIQALQLITSLLSHSMSCFQADPMVMGVACGFAATLAMVEVAMADMQAENLEAEFANEFTRFRERLQGAFDLIEAKEVQMHNATDEVRRILGQLRSTRVAARSALAGALFANSDPAGRTYPVNTVMRRGYDINLQRYRAAHRAAVRSATIARMAIEQRFGVNLEEQTCASLVEPPSSWAADVCNTTGINYGELRDPDVEVGEEAIRQMFIGDYVRRLEQYVESYRFDFPFTSGADLTIVSLRDDVVRAQSPCVEPVDNLVGSSNNLRETALPLSSGGLDAIPYDGWQAVGCGSGELEPEATRNCVAVRQTTGPRIEMDMSTGPPGPVGGLDEASSPRGFQVVFAPGGDSMSYVGDYADTAAMAQQVLLSGGVYRLSWYQKEAPGPTVPTVEARVSFSVADTGSVYSANERVMTDGWKRYFRFFQVPAVADGAPVQVGVYPVAMESALYEQVLTLAGVQLEPVTGSTSADAWVGNSVDPAKHGPALFVATTAAGYARYENCVVGEPAAFRDRWSYHCTELCSGGFGTERCLPGEEPETFCYWELPFEINEDRLLGRGGSFGGGFAFGNFNYRTAEIAVNVVGTGVRACTAESPDSCYSTAGIPFSLTHGPPGYDGDMNAYTVRGHDGGLEPVYLFNGWIESARALAAERYLTNPVSSADLSLLQDYNRREFRGRPMTGVYRFILWDSPGLNFQAVEDIQVLWRYRYFTRTGEALSCTAPPASSGG